MKLEIGKFIRTPYGIRKIVNITKDDGYGKPKVRVIELDRHLNTPYKFDYIFYADENVIKKCKTSYNIIDILEVGDIIRYRIDKVPLETKGYLTGVIDITDEEMLENIKEDKNYHVLQILTKEQFEQMSYKIKENK